MTRLALILALLPCAAFADALPPRVSVHHDAPPGSAWYARATIENRRGLYNETTLHETDLGPVAVQYWTTLPSAKNDAASADRACVVATPPGIVAMPECVEVLEQETGEILLLKYLGG